MLVKISAAGVLLALMIVGLPLAISGLPGGWQSADIDDEDIRRVSSYAVDQIEEINNSDYEMGVVSMELWAW